MADEKCYYELSNENTGESLLCSMNLPIKPEKLPEMFCLDGYTARQVSKEYFERESANE